MQHPGGERRLANLGAMGFERSKTVIAVKSTQAQRDVDRVDAGDVAHAQGTDHDAERWYHQAADQAAAHPRQPRRQGRTHHLQTGKQSGNRRQFMARSTIDVSHHSGERLRRSKRRQRLGVLLGIGVGFTREVFEQEGHYDRQQQNPGSQHRSDRQTDSDSSVHPPPQSGGLRCRPQ